MVVAGRVLASGHHHLVACNLLGLLGDDVSFALLRDHIADEAFLRLDIIRNLAGFVTILTILEHRLSDPFIAQRVVYSHGINSRTVGLHSDEFGVQLHRLVVDYTFAVEESCAIAEHDHRVRRLITDGRIQLRLCKHTNGEEQRCQYLTYVHIIPNYDTKL